MITFDTIKEDTTNRSQSWEYEAILRNVDALVRVHVRRNAHEDQSHAKIELWSGRKWEFFTSLPTEAWWEDAPSYGRRELTQEDVDGFRWVAAQLVDDVSHALFGSRDFLITGSVGQ